MIAGLPRPLRVAFDGTPLLEARPTGVARAFRGWLAGLEEASHPVRITVFVPGSGALADPPEGVELVRLGGGPRFRWVDSAYLSNEPLRMASREKIPAISSQRSPYWSYLR